MVHTKPREAKMMLVAGRKGVGKTYQTLVHIANYLKNSLKKKGRKVLIFDVNNEYGNVQEDHHNKHFPAIKTIKLNQVPAFSQLNRPHAARVTIFKEVGGKMNLSEMGQALGYILQYYRNGLLLIEDITKFITDSMPGDLIGSICTQRHVSVDVIIHLQTVGKLFNPKLWGNCNEVRLHKAEDTVLRHRDKVSGNIEHLHIMEQLIDYKYKQGDTRFCCYLDKDYNKIRGNFTRQEFKNAVESYLSKNYAKVLKPILEQRDIYTGKRIFNNQREAVVNYVNEKMQEYL